MILGPTPPESESRPLGFEQPIVSPQLRKALEIDEAINDRNPFTLPGLIYGVYYGEFHDEWSQESQQDAVEATAAAATLETIKRITDKVATHGDVFHDKTARATALRVNARKRIDAMDPTRGETFERFEDLDDHFITYMLMISTGNKKAIQLSLDSQRQVAEQLGEDTPPEARRYMQKVVSIVYQAGANPSATKNALLRLVNSVRAGEYDDLIEASHLDPILTIPESSDILLGTNKEQYLNFQILPPDTNLEELSRDIFDESTDTEKTHVDLRRVELLAQIRELVGEDKCFFARGEKSGRTYVAENGERINEDYIVLAIQHHNNDGVVVGEDALAISPIARKHAAYMVRHDVSTDIGWRDIFQFTKEDARALGARRVKFSQPKGQDIYSTMQEKLFSLFTCSAADFSGELRQGKNGYRLVTRRRLGSQAIGQAMRASVERPE